MAHLTYVKRLAKQLGATVDDRKAGRFTMVNVDAPAGKVWSANGAHTLAAEWRNGDAEYRIASVTDLVERIGMGLDDCDDPECELCHTEA